VTGDVITLYGHRKSEEKIYKSSLKEAEMDSILF
jgi:hypothetical protein